MNHSVFPSISGSVFLVALKIFVLLFHSRHFVFILLAVTCVTFLGGLFANTGCFYVLTAMCLAYCNTLPERCLQTLFFSGQAS